MKNQSLILLVVAVGCGLVAMLGVRQALSQKPAELEETTSVLSATALIQPGDRLNELNTRFIDVPISSCPEGAISVMDDVAERALMVPVMPGDWILKGKLTEKGEMGAVASLPTGMATVTIPVDATTSHSGMLRPGNRVDLLLTFLDTSSGTNQQKTITVLEFVEVFAVDARIYGIDKEGDATAKNISLLVTPEQGKVVTLAKSVGILSTMMRARGDAEKTGKAEISQEFLTSSFQGSNRNAPSVMGGRGRDEDSDSVVSDELEESMESYATLAEPTVDELISQELSRVAVKDPGGSELIVQITDESKEKNIWTMEIYEGETIRLEAVEIPVVANVDTSGTSSEDWNLWDLLKSK